LKYSKVINVIKKYNLLDNKDFVEIYRDFETINSMLLDEDTFNLIRKIAKLHLEDELSYETISRELCLSVNRTINLYKFFIELLEDFLYDKVIEKLAEQYTYLSKDEIYRIAETKFAEILENEYKNNRANKKYEKIAKNGQLVITFEFN
jgi:hypothetical protein